MNKNLKLGLLGVAGVVVVGATCYAFMHDVPRRRHVPVVAIYDDWDTPFVRIDRHFDRMFREMERDFNRFERPAFHQRRMLRMDAFVKDNKFYVKTDLPGLTKEEIEISAQNGILTISGEKKNEDKEKKDGYYLNERFASSFARTISLPKGADVDKAETEFKDGVLTITMPIQELPKPEVKKLPIK